MLPLYPGPYDYSLGDPTNPTYDARLRDPTFNPGAVWSLRPGAVWVWQGGDVDSGSVGFWSADSTPQGGVNPDSGFGSFLRSVAVGLGVGAGVGGLTTAVAAGNVATGQDVNANLGDAAVLDAAGAAVVGGTVYAGGSAVFSETNGSLISPPLDFGNEVPLIDASVNPVTAPALTAVEPEPIVDLVPPVADVGSITPAADVTDLGAITPSGVADAVSAAPPPPPPPGGLSSAAVSAGISKLFAAVLPSKPAPTPTAPAPVHPTAPAPAKSNAVPLLALAALALKFL